jgi:hypothetical protein
MKKPRSTNELMALCAKWQQKHIPLKYDLHLLIASEIYRLNRAHLDFANQIGKYRCETEALAEEKLEQDRQYITLNAICFVLAFAEVHEVPMSVNDAEEFGDRWQFRSPQQVLAYMINTLSKLLLEVSSRPEEEWELRSHCQSVLNYLCEYLPDSEGGVMHLVLQHLQARYV